MIACIVQALETVHSNGKVHTDINPTNLIFDNRGYLKLTSFARTKHIGEPALDASEGAFRESLGYIAPEVLQGKTYDIAADYFATGVVAWELLFSSLPYDAKDATEILSNMNTYKARIKHNDLPEGWSWEAADFINKCIGRTPKYRLGYYGNEEVKAHPWLKDFDWSALRE